MSTMIREPKATNTRYASTEQHDVARCEQGLSPVLSAVCRCGGKLFAAQRGNGPAFFASLPADDPHSFQTLPSQEAQLISRGEAIELKGVTGHYEPANIAPKHRGRSLLGNKHNSREEPQA